MYSDTFEEPEAVKTSYIHLGDEITNESFKLNPRIDLFCTMNKPIGGLWACRQNNRPENYYTWEAWCKDNDFDLKKYMGDDHKHYFELKDDAKILFINGNAVDFKGIDADLTEEDFTNIIGEDYDVISYSHPNIHNRDYNPTYAFSLDWDYVIKNYDGVELIHGNIYTILRYSGFYSWDCDSIVIWNPNKVILNKRKEGNKK